MTRLRGLGALKGERASSTWFLTAAGRPQLSSPPRATTASKRPACSMGLINGERFHAYVEQLLVPTPKPGDALTLDNLGSHKGKAARKATSGCRGLASSSPPATSPTSTST